MNVSRLAEFAGKLVAIEDNRRVSNRLSQISAKLQEIINQPQNAQFQAELLALVADLKATMIEINLEVTPAVVDFLSEVEGAHYFSVALPDEIGGLIHTNSITPAVVKERVDQINSKRSTLIEALRAISHNLKALGLQPEPLAEGQAEIGFKIPRALFDNRLIGFSGELKFIERVVEAFSEAVTGAREEAELSELSTTDPLVLLHLYAPVVVAIGGSVTWFLSSWKKTLEIQELRARLKAMDIDATSQLDSKIEKIVHEAVEARIQQVLVVRDDEGRNNEVRNGLRMVLTELWARVERGMTVEVRFLPPPLKENPTPQEVQEADAYKELEEIQKALVFPAITSEPMLELPGTETAKSKPGKAAPKKSGSKK